MLLAAALLVLPTAGAAADVPERQVRVLLGGTDEIDAFEPFFVQHGWNPGTCVDGQPDAEAQAQFDAEFPLFRLYLDGELQQAELIAGCFTAQDGSEFAGKFHRTVFPDGLAPGSYTLLGEWWDDAGDFAFAFTLTLDVKPRGAPFMPPGLLGERPTGPPEGVPPSRP